MTAIAIRSPHIRPIGVVLASIILVGLSYVVPNFFQRHSAVGTTGNGAPAAILDPEAGPSGGSLAQIDRSIAAWTANLAANDRDFLSATNLGLLYDARARLSGDVADYQRAVQATERAIAIAPDQLPGRLLHARLLQATHDFEGALTESRTILRDDPSQAQALATEGDAQLELGDLTSAEAAFRRLAAEVPGSAVTARLSRVAFLRGDPATALTLATRAYDEARAAGNTGPGLSWYAFQSGTVALSTGDPTLARSWFERALTDWPGSFLALAGAARADAGLGRMDDAVAGYQAAIAIVPLPDSLAALGDLYALRGEDRLATEQYDTVGAIARLAAINRQVFNRQLVLFSVNHDRDVVEALQLADQELAVRKDVYGYDAEAWALLANGRAADADAAMRQALSLGTRDALLDYHAGAIAAALHDNGRARDLLVEALSISGALDPLSSSRAAAILAGLP